MTGPKSITKAWVIQKKGFEYNDEIYHTPESEGGTPIKVFLNYEKANEEYVRYEKDSWISTDMCNYFYSNETSGKDIRDIARRYPEQFTVGGEKEDIVESLFATNSVTPQAIDEMATVINVWFYSVEEVSIDLATGEMVKPRKPKSLKPSNRGKNNITLIRRNR